MACVALASLISTIKLELLQPIPRVPLLHEDEAAIKSFLETLSSLQAFLEESNAATAATKDLEIEIRDFALKAEDNIEIQLSNFLLAKDTECREKASQNLHYTLQVEAEKATELLKIIIHDITTTETQPSIQRPKHPPRGPSRSSPKLVGRMVGRRRDHTDITNKLVFGDLDLKMISIVGMVGIGKTTLAKSVYEDLLVRTYFLLRIWITMPQEYNKNQILRLLLRSISPAAEEKIKKGSHREVTKLAKEVWRQLSYQRYLIVLDNLQGQWNEIRGYFPEQSNGSRILVTTTHFDRYVYSGSFFYIHNMTLLDQDESWDLFYNTVSLNKGCMAPEFEKIRSHIVEICDGLPWSIIAVAKRLSKCNNVLKEWEKIKKEIESLGILDRNALTLNYNKLSHNLKVCFLYLGVFPKRREILVKKLVGLWIAEGFLEPLEHGELENQGYAYLQKLIDRSLVLICSWSSSGEIKTCRMHSAMHSFCVGEAQKESIFCAVNTVQHSGLPLSEFANSCRWLSLCTHSFDYYVLFSTNNCRSIFFFDEDPETFVPLKLLRILAFVPSPFLQRLSMHLGDLIFLRYLSVTQWFEGLEDVLSSNLNLQTLVFSSSESQLGAPTLHLPSTIWVSPKLRHLELGNMYTIDPPSVVKKNLQTLSWAVTPTYCGKEMYLNFPNLRKLKIFCREDLESSHGSSNNHIILDNFNNIKWLERLTIWVSMGCTITLSELFPSRLKKLKLSGMNLSETDLSVIGRLPRLEYLKLQDVSLGRIWRVAYGEFLELRFLLLEDKKLEQFMVENRALPSLERLVLRFCYCLEKVPYDFAFNSYLKSIELDTHMPNVFSTAKLILKWQWLLRRGRFELIIDGDKYVEEQFAEVLVELDLIDIGGFMEKATTPTKFIFLLVLYIVVIIIHVLLYGSISRQFIIISLRLPLKENNWILAVISTCLACIGSVITLYSLIM